MEELNEKVKVYFAGVDYWNRATFREVFDEEKYYCDIYKVFDHNTTEEKIIAWYSCVGTAAISYKGNSFDSEPWGDPAKVEIVTREEAAKMVTNFRRQ